MRFLQTYEFVASFASPKYRTAHMDTTALARGSQWCVACQKQLNIETAVLKKMSQPSVTVVVLLISVCENVTKKCGNKNVEESQYPIRVVPNIEWSNLFSFVCKCTPSIAENLTAWKTMSNILH